MDVVDSKLVVQVRAGGPARFADMPDNVALADAYTLADARGEAVQMPVMR